MRELVDFARLTRALWRGDATRSITGSRAVTNALELALVLLVVAWPAVSLVSVRPGPEAIPPELLTALVDDAVEGAVLVSACIACVLIVLLPASRALDTMTTALPLSRTTRAIGPVLPVLGAATIGGPVVVAPLLAPAVRLADPVVAVASVVLAGCAALAAALVTTATVQSLRWVGSRLGAAEALAVTVAASVSLAVWAAVLLGVRAVAPPARGSITQELVVRGACCAGVLLVGVASLTGAARLPRLAAVAAGVRVFPRAGRCIARGRAPVVDVLLWVRDPVAVSTLLLTALVVAFVAVGECIGLTLADLLALPVLVGAPIAVGLVHYGTDRAPSWRRSTVVPLHLDAWPVVRTVQGAALAFAGALVTGALVVPQDVGADVGLLLASAALATGSGLLSGVLVPSDLELPGGTVVAAASAGLLTGVPVSILTALLPDGGATLPLSILAGVLLAATPFAIQARRRRAITA